MSFTKNQMDMVERLARNDFREAKQGALLAIDEDTTKKNEDWRKWIRKELESNISVLELPFKARSFLDVEYPSETFVEGRYYLSDREAALYNHIKKMYAAAEKLIDMKIPYLNSVLLTGKSGVGKTMFGRYLAYKMDKPLVYVNFAQTIDSYMGKTGKNIVTMFEGVADLDCVFFLDEIDAIANKRGGNDGASKELGRTTTVLMNHLDKLNNRCLVIAATNVLGSLDPALLRRFNKIHEVLDLSPEEKGRMVQKYLNDVGLYLPDNRKAISSFVAEAGNTSMVISRLIEAIATSLIEDKPLSLEIRRIDEEKDG